MKHVPIDFENYFEPFFGGGALFWHLRAKFSFFRATLADINSRLVTLYTVVKRNPDALLEELSKSIYKVDQKVFYKHRSNYAIDDASDIQIAAWYLYMNKTCFNGLYRVNSKGQFNTPWGHKKPGTIIVDPDLLSVCSRALARAHIECDPFDVSVKTAKKGDFVYFDPPYLPISQTSSFTKYHLSDFTWEDHVRLHDTAAVLKKRGVRVLISNSANPEIVKLYSKSKVKFDIHRVKAARSINSKGDGRGKITELMIT